MPTTADEIIRAATALQARPPRATTPEDAVHLAPDGTVHVRLAGVAAPLVLPRPSFGQIKRLIKAEGLIADRIQATIASASAAGSALADEAEAIGSATADKLDELASVRVRARKVADECTDEVSATLVDWWNTIYATLGETTPGAGDGAAPDEDSWPSVTMDATLPQRMVAHWRFIPTGPG